MAEKYTCKGEGCPAYQLDNDHVTFCRVANKTPVDLGDVCLNSDFAYHAQSPAKRTETYYVLEGVRRALSNPEKPSNPYSEYLTRSQARRLATICDTSARATILERVKAQMPAKSTGQLQETLDRVDVNHHPSFPAHPCSYLRPRKTKKTQSQAKCKGLRLRYSPGPHPDAGSIEFT